MVAVIAGSEAAGFALALGAASCFETGYALQALEARRAPRAQALRPSLLAYLLRRPRWVGATALSLVGWPLQILALSQAPLTLVQPVLALGLLLLLGLGVKVLHEPVGGREIAAVLLIIAAVGTITWAAPSQLGTVDRGPGLVIALSLLAAIAVAPYIVSLSKRRPVLLLVVGAGAADGMAAFVAKLISEDAADDRWLIALAWAAAAAAVVTLGVVSESSALQRAAATRVAPAILVMQIAIPVAMAPLVGGEGWGTTPLGGAVLVGALVTLVAGVALLGSSPAVVDVIAERPAEP